MNEPTHRLTLAEQIRKGLEEAIQHATGQTTLPTTTLNGLDQANAWTVVLTELRSRHQMSQDDLARLLNVRVATLRGWEEGTRRPSRVAQRLVEVFQRNPQAIPQFIG